jgi:uncharacterized OB-fold protein
VKVEILQSKKANEGIHVSRRNCPKCGHEIHFSLSQNCAYCGASLREETEKEGNSGFSSQSKPIVDKKKEHTRWFAYIPIAMANILESPILAYYNVVDKSLHPEKKLSLIWISTITWFEIVFVIFYILSPTSFRLYLVLFMVLIPILYLWTRNKYPHHISSIIQEEER